MNLDLNDIITFDEDEKYIIASKTEFENKTYYYLGKLDDSKDVKFCVESNGQLFEIHNQDLILEILPALATEAAKALQENIKEIE